MWIADKLAYRNQENFIRAYKGDEMVWEKSHPDYLTFKANTAGSTVKMAAVGTPSKRPDLEYSTDGIHWNTYSIGNTITLSNVNDYVQFRGDNDGFCTDESNCHRFSMTGSIAASGSIMSLLDKTDDMVVMTAANDRCFYRMFQDCTALTTPPSLPATTLSEGCYFGLFRGCSALTTPPQLPALNLAGSCYKQIFFGCSSLTSAPSLPATTIYEQSYNSMFTNCSSLTTAPEINATNATEYCFYQMFYGCSSLTSVPSKLPATTLANYCYQSMFNGCTSITTTPELPATTLQPYCYSRMFQGCTSLTSSPVLPATTLVSNCYEQMFRGCSRLNHIEAHFTTTPGTSYTSNWVYGVASRGTFVKSRAATWTTTGVNGVPTSWVVEYPKDYLTFTANTAGSTVKMAAVGYPTTPELEYSTDGIQWRAYTIGNTITLRNINDYVQFRGDNDGFCEEEDHYNRFEMTGRIKASGSIMSLIDKTVNMVTMTSANKRCFYMLFDGCTALTTAPSLPATTLTDFCYTSMFNGCTALTTAPTLPATTLAIACYQQMFNGCTALTTAPTLPATTLKNFCYTGMFYGCTALTTAPSLPATTLTDFCYSGMFYGCNRLNRIKAMFLTKPGVIYTRNWVNGVSATGTFVKNRNATWDSSGVNSVPENWTIQYE